MLRDAATLSDAVMKLEDQRLAFKLACQAAAAAKTASDDLSRVVELLRPSKE